MHPHSHDPGTGRAFAIGIALNLAFVLAEWTCGVLANSLSLIADATHNFSDVLGLALAWGAMALARRPPSMRFTYGLRGTTILAALGNAMLLLVATGGIAWEAILRFKSTTAVNETNLPAAAAYRNAGFAETGGRKPMPSHPGHFEIDLSRPIGSGR